MQSTGIPPGGELTGRRPAESLDAESLDNETTILIQSTPGFYAHVDVFRLVAWMRPVLFVGRFVPCLGHLASRLSIVHVS